MAESIDLSHIYELRNNFTVIALTGRTSSGCSTVAHQLALGFNNGIGYEKPIVYNHNSYRKYRIVYNYAKVNFQPYTLIKYRHVLTLFLLQQSFDEFISFLKSKELEHEFSDSQLEVRPNFDDEIVELTSLKSEFEEYSSKFNSIPLGDLKTIDDWLALYDFFFQSSFTNFCDKISSILKKKSLVKRNKTLQIISNNLRKSGKPYKNGESAARNVDTIVDVINKLIKSHRKKTDYKRTQIVIDSLRNPFEILFFRQRFSAFYLFAINRDKQKRESALFSKFTEDEPDDRDQLVKEEDKGGEDYEFFKQKIQACIEQADVHISFLTPEETEAENKKREENIDHDHTSPYFSWPMQLLKYVCLISHPGLISPSPEERCMQMAFTAKHNSGCISRHVGAAITDEFYSIKAIGWNNTPEGQVPCSLRNIEDLFTHGPDFAAFTDYEHGNLDFKENLIENFKSQIESNEDKLCGRQVCFCFKSVKNSFSEGKNQVHTRSLHAEENAFLQLAKYGGMGIKGGKLFTTASPCELCAKKAYQLGIRVIYYIDPYPGISDKQILQVGDSPIKVRLFNGVIGNAYHWLFDPIMPYKDELTLLLGNPLKDLTSRYEKEIQDQDKEIQDRDNIIEKLNQRIEELENKKR